MMNDLFFVGVLITFFFTRHNKNSLLMMYHVSSDINQSLFLFIGQTIWIMDIKIQFCFGFSLVYILPSWSSAFRKMKMYFTCQYVSYGALYIHTLRERVKGWELRIEGGKLKDWWWKVEKLRIERWELKNWKIEGWKVENWELILHFSISPFSMFPYFHVSIFPLLRSLLMFIYLCVFIGIKLSRDLIPSKTFSFYAWFFGSTYGTRKLFYS